MPEPWGGKPRSGAHPQHTPRSGFQSAPLARETGVARVRASALPRLIRSRALYTPPLTPPELVFPKAGYSNRKEEADKGRVGKGGEVVTR